MNKKRLTIIAGLILTAGLGVLLAPVAHDAYVVHGLVERNIEARGGRPAWEKVEALRYTGTMEIGQGLEVPFVLEQERPDRMCLTYEFDGAKVEQCSDGEHGWKRAPFTGRDDVQSMTEAELREAADAADPRGLLFDWRARGHRIDLRNDERIGDRDVHVLKVTLASGAERTVWLDAETALEVKVESSRMLAGRERRVETTFDDWKSTHGLLIPRTQVTRTEGDDQAHALVVETLQVNPKLEVTRFLPPASVRTTTGEG
jgi:hypothetical protein